MSRDFEFRQILRAYRNGIIDEATFEKEMARLEGDSNGVSTNGGSFRAMGKSYPSERAAIMNFLENTAAGEAGAPKLSPSGPRFARPIVFAADCGWSPNARPTIRANWPSACTSWAASARRP